MSSGISESSGSGSGSGGTQGLNRDFKIILDLKAGGGQVFVHLVAPTMQVRFQNSITKLLLQFCSSRFCFSINLTREWPCVKKNDFIFLYFRRKLRGLVILASAWTMFDLMTFYIVQCRTRVLSQCRSPSEMIQSFSMMTWTSDLVGRSTRAKYRKSDMQHRKGYFRGSQIFDSLALTFLIPFCSHTEFLPTVLLY